MWIEIAKPKQKTTTVCFLIFLSKYQDRCPCSRLYASTSCATVVRTQALTTKRRHLRLRGRDVISMRLHSTYDHTGSGCSIFKLLMVVQALWLKTYALRRCPQYSHIIDISLVIQPQVIVRSSATIAVFRYTVPSCQASIVPPSQVHAIHRSHSSAVA